MKTRKLISSLFILSTIPLLSFAQATKCTEMNGFYFKPTVEIKPENASVKNPSTVYVAQGGFNTEKPKGAYCEITARASLHEDHILAGIPCKSTFLENTTPSAGRMGTPGLTSCKWSFSSSCAIKTIECHRGGVSLRDAGNADSLYLNEADVKAALKGVIKVAKNEKDLATQSAPSGAGAKAAKAGASAEGSSVR